MKFSKDVINEKPNRGINLYRKIIIFSIVAGFLLLITNSAVWVNRQIFNSDNFTDTVTSSITSESSRRAIAQNITDRIFNDRPIAKRVAGDFSTKIIGGLLDTNQYNNLLSVTVERLQVYVTSSNQEDVIIELGGVKDVIAKLVVVSESLGREASVDPNNIPEQITILEEENVPDLYSSSIAMLWLAPITLVVALVLLTYPYLKRWSSSKKILIIQGSVIIFVSFTGYLMGPLFKPAVLSQIKQENRTIVGNLFDAFNATFVNQTIQLTLIGLLMVLVGTFWLGYPFLKNTVTKLKK